MSSEINSWEKYPVRVLDPESSEAKRLMAEFDEERQEPKRFAELHCRSLPAKSPTEEELRAAGFDPKTMLPPGHPVSRLANMTGRSLPVPPPSRLAQNWAITDQGIVTKRSAGETAEATARL